MKLKGNLMKKIIKVILIVLSILIAIFAYVQVNKEDVSNALNQYTITDNLELKVRPDYNKINKIASSKIDFNSLVKENKDYEIKVKFDDTNKNTVNILKVITNDYKLEYHLDYNKALYIRKNIYFKDSGIIKIDKKEFKKILTQKKGEMNTVYLNYAHEYFNYSRELEDLILANDSNSTKLAKEEDNLRDSMEKIHKPMDEEYDKVKKIQIVLDLMK